MIDLVIDGKNVKVKRGSTILQACSTVGIEIPRFCYHEKLSIAGNCRMCLVEVQNSPKPVASCAMPVMDNMVVKTNSMMVKKAREGVLELLLINHPLDCPICDQGGECDLQDQAMVFGNDRGRYFEYKRAVQDKNIGPLIKTIMTRCIHCTRCVRFATEIAGVETLGTTGRGSHTEIGTYIEKSIDSELSGNLIDLCPVGALTSKPYAFTARSWELKGIDSIDVFDGIGSNIRVDIRGADIMRILPRVNETINEEWISDKVRFAYDGLKRQRLTSPMILVNNETLVPCDWKEAFSLIKDELSTSKNFKAVCGKSVDSETMFAFKKLVNQFINKEDLSSKSNSLFDIRSNYLLNSQIEKLPSSDLCLFINTNPRVEAPTLNARIRQSVIKKKTRVFTIGPTADLTYPVTDLGNNLDILLQIAEGRHPLCQSLSNAKNPMIMVGFDLMLTHGQFVNSAINEITKLADIHPDSVNYLHKDANTVGFFDLGLSSVVDLDYNAHSSDKSDVVYLLAADDYSVEENSFVIYQGHHGDQNAPLANVILPGLAFTEKNGFYVNTEGRPQEAKKAVTAPGKSQPDWEILAALSYFLDVPTIPTTFNELRQELVKECPHFVNLGNIEGTLLQPKTSHFRVKLSDVNYTSKEVKLSPSITDFYLTDPITRASKTMVKCSNTKKNQS